MSEINNSKGFVKLLRTLWDTEMFETATPEQKVIFITLLVRVNHKPKKYHSITGKYQVKPGQIITSYSNLAKLCGKGITRDMVRSALKKFVRHGLIEVDAQRHRNTIITILNWKSTFGAPDPNKEQKPTDEMITDMEPPEEIQIKNIAVQS